MGKGRLGKPMAAFTTLGCKVNQYETQRILDSFEERGFAIADFTWQVAPALLLWRSGERNHDMPRQDTWTACVDYEDS